MNETQIKTEEKITEQYKEQVKRYDARIEKAKAKKREILRKEKGKQKKLRTRKLIEIGGLAAIAELTDFDKGVLLGILLQGRQLIEDESTYNNLKRLGDSTLQYRKKLKSMK